MNIILPSGISRFDTSSSKFNIGDGSILIGQYAGTQLEELGNVFIGNYAGENARLVSDSVFLGMYAGQHIENANKSIIIGNDLSSAYSMKDNILSIGFNNIEKESIAIGSNIFNTGINNVITGRNILAESTNTFAYGRDLNIQTSYYFIDSLLYNDDQLLLEGYNKIGLKDIKINANILISNDFYIKYEIDNFINFPDTIFTNETDIIFHFKPFLEESYCFNLGFYIDNCNLIDFKFRKNEILYTNKETNYNFTYLISLTDENPIIYNQYNIVHLINNDKNYNAMSLYINPQYNGFKVNKELSKNYTNGLINNIKNLNINNIKLNYSIDNYYNAINSNFIYDTYYKNKYLNIYNTASTTSNISIYSSNISTSNEYVSISSNISTSNEYVSISSNISTLNEYVSISSNISTSNIIYINDSSNIYSSNFFDTKDYYSFNNLTKNLSFKNFIISINDISTTNNFNIVSGKNLNIKGTQNICIGNYNNIEGDESIIIGNSLNNTSKKSIILGISNFNNIFNKSSIVIGNDNFNNIDSTSIEYEKFLSKKPVILGSDINDITYDVNICDTILKYSNDKKDLLLTGKDKKQNSISVAIGYKSKSDVPIKGIYELQYSSNILWNYNDSNITSNYYLNNEVLTTSSIITTSNSILEVKTTNEIFLQETNYSLYINNGIYTDIITLYNNSNYATSIKNNEKNKNNINYILPTILNDVEYSNNTLYLSYTKGTREVENELLWKSLENTFQTMELSTKNITVSEYIFSSNFIGIGSNLTNVNFEDRDTSLLKEGSNLYFTPERVGIITNSSNIKTMNYILLTSNQISKRISSLTTNEIVEGNNLYYTDERYDTRLLTKTLDNIYNGTSNKYITNDIYTNNLLITGTLTVGKIQVLGIDFKNHNNTSYLNNDIVALKQHINELNEIVKNLTDRIILLENK